MIIALLPNTAKSEAKELAVALSLFLRQRSITVVTEDSEAESLEAQRLSTLGKRTVDFVISIGGDGTILRLLHTYAQLNAPIIGINRGSLGFLADIPASTAFASLEQILNGQFKAQERMMLQGERENGNSHLALNEIVVHRAMNHCLIDLAVFVDDVYLNTFSADGIIVATPSGSTAYSLSAGGPILTPDLRALVITPICPHAVSNRPIVLMPNRSIRIEHIGKQRPVEVIFDGFFEEALPIGASLHITCAKNSCKLVNLLDHEYFSTLRTKLGWTGSLKT